MTKLEQQYKCDVCGNIVEVLHAGQGTLVCCGKSMTLQLEESKENIIPIIEKFENIKKIYTGENDEEVLNCEGEPCNFVYDDIKIPN
jgi:superoxide reductase